MSNYIVLPELGEGIDEGTITSIAVGVGDQVKEGQTLLEVETDKVVLEVPAKKSGTVGALFISEGQNVRPGVRLLSLQKGALTGDEESKIIVEAKKLPEPEFDEKQPEELVPEVSACATECPSVGRRSVVDIVLAASRGAVLQRRRRVL